MSDNSEWVLDLPPLVFDTKTKKIVHDSNIKQYRFVCNKCRQPQHGLIALDYLHDHRTCPCCGYTLELEIKE